MSEWNRNWPNLHKNSSPKRLFQVPGNWVDGTNKKRRFRLLTVSLIHRISKSFSKTKLQCNLKKGSNLTLTASAASCWRLLSFRSQSTLTHYWSAIPSSFELLQNLLVQSQLLEWLRKYISIKTKSLHTVWHERINSYSNCTKYIWRHSHMLSTISSSAQLTLLWKKKSQLKTCRLKS